MRGAMLFAEDRFGWVGVLLQLADINFASETADPHRLLKLITLDLVHQPVVVLLPCETGGASEEDLLCSFLRTTQQEVASPTKWRADDDRFPKANANTFWCRVFELIAVADVELEGHRVLRILWRKHVLPCRVGLDELSIVSSFMRWAGPWGDLRLIEIRALSVPDSSCALHERLL